MAELIVHGGVGAKCPECGAEATGWESSGGMREKVDRYEAWEGGPVLEVPTKMVVMEPDGPLITRVQPCGHVVDAVVHQ